MLVNILIIGYNQTVFRSLLWGNLPLLTDSLMLYKISLLLTNFILRETLLVLELIAYIDIYDANACL